jgi:hypothetical protein
MRKLLFALLAILLTSTAAAAQGVAKVAGTPQELKGVTKIFVRSDYEAPRRHIIRLIKEQLPQLTIVETSFEAEVILTFGETRRPYRGISRGPANPLSELIVTSKQVEPGVNAPAAEEEFEIVGTGEVLKPSGPTVSKVLFTFRGAVSSALEDKLSSEYADLFIKLYKKANR